MTRTFTGTFTENSNNVLLLNLNNVKNTGRLFPELFVYSEAVKPCTKIISITDNSSIVISANAVKSGDFVINFSDSVPFKYLDICESLRDVQQIVNNNGIFIKLPIRSELNVGRDDYNSIRTRTRENTIIVKAHPVIFNPTDEQIESAGFKEDQTAILYFARKDFIDRGLDFEDFDEIRGTAKLFDNTYLITDKNRVKQIGDEYLYYTLGIRLK